MRVEFLGMQRRELTSRSILELKNKQWIVVSVDGFGVDILAFISGLRCPKPLFKVSRAVNAHVLLAHPTHFNLWLLACLIKGFCWYSFETSNLISFISSHLLSLPKPALIIFLRSICTTISPTYSNFLSSFLMTRLLAISDALRQLAKQSFGEVPK